MTTAAAQVSASQMRVRIPAEWLIEFQDWGDGALLSLSEDASVKREVRAYAGWELDYRIAFSVDDPAPSKVGR